MPSLRLPHRQRARLTWMLALCLLFQQFAMAVYACPLEHLPAQSTAMGAQCAAMGMAKRALASPVLCRTHCNPDSAATAAAHVSDVPPLALPPPVFARVAMTPEVIGLRTAQVPLHRSDPPPILRFCSLLI